MLSERVASWDYACFVVVVSGLRYGTDQPRHFLQRVLPRNSAACPTHSAPQLPNAHALRL